MLPKELLEPGKKLMHVSDTPESIYPFLEDLIEKVKPNIIVHTGDLADNIKLERKPWLREEYRRAVQRLIGILGRFGALVYLVPGNEDDIEVLRELSPDFILVRPGTVLEIGPFQVALGHRAEDVKDVDADFKLYGHNFKLIERGLNGVLNVNFILLPEGKVIKVNYPQGTNHDRGYRLLRVL
ncbi:Hypothetical metallophosphoesterase [Pyrococcus yayanosii CH1]|uniref:Hypothetical metallophosphoesterase n=1 Tax=Pyrococcus yayanosii (strain CH1 / JCM 16557) TaxID=529709 RepID=F8AEK6_PYRYC|nr:Hypothetical metallophosphoesterase [Pyrococcus yayanosii CH1]